MARKKQFNPKSEYVRYDKNSKLWIEVRKRNYLYWCKYLQICINREYDIDESKYKGWDLDGIRDLHFDTWWKNHWEDLFGFEREQKTLKKITEPKFTVSTSRIKTNYIRLSLLVNNNIDYGTNFEISEKIHIEESLKRYPTLFHQPHEIMVASDTRGKSVRLKEYDKIYITEVISRLKKRSKKIIKNVGDGVFP